MDPNVILPLLSSVVSFVFAALVLDQWLRRRRPYQLVWTIGLLWYGISAGTEFVGGAFGWSDPLYRAWYLFGAFGVAAYLGLGTVYLLNRTRFGYFVAFSLFAGGLFSILSAVARAREGDPVAPAAVVAVVGVASLGAVMLIATTRLDRRFVAPATATLLAAASMVVTVLVLTAPLEAPGYALDPATGVPVGTAFPSYVRILTPPFNITGAFALVFGAVYSAYIFMPKRRVVRVRTAIPLVSHAARAVAVTINFAASIPAAIAAGRRGQLNSRVPATLLIALGGFIPGWTSGLNRFGVTWAFFLGELVGVVLIFAGFLVSIEVFSDLRIPFTEVVIGRRAVAAEANRSRPG
ncbi:MAG: hypothetical protein ABR509_08235 [Candidatus Limnocylindria bacterium]